MTNDLIADIYIYKCFCFVITYILHIYYYTTYLYITYLICYILFYYSFVTLWLHLFSSSEIIMLLQKNKFYCLEYYCRIFLEEALIKGKCKNKFIY